MINAELAEQICELQAIEAVKRLSAEYGDIADDNHNADRMVTTFTEEGVWDGGDEKAEGHAEIQALFSNFAEQTDFFQYNAFSPTHSVEPTTGAVVGRQ